MKRKRDDGTEVDVEYTVISWGSPDSWSSYGGDPGDPAEVEITTVTDDAGCEVQLSDLERERIEEEIAEIVYSEGPGDDYE